MAQLAEYSKWLVATAALTLGLVSHLTRSANTSLLKYSLSGSVVAFLGSVISAAIGVYQFTVLSAQFRDPEYKVDAQGAVNSLAASAAPLLKWQVGLFAVGVLGLCIFLVVSIFQDQTTQQKNRGTPH